ncbi:MAG: response regulator [Proteobacteria bacterium]|nr:response regulator [Pseudomonadota bacterium]
MALNPLRSAKRTVGALRLLLAAAVLVPALLVGVAAWQNRKVLLEEAEQRSIRTTAILQQHAVSTFELYDLAFLRVADFLRSRRQPSDLAELHLFLQRLDLDVGSVDAVFVVDAAGGVISHSRFPPPLVVDVTDRDYFVALKEGKARVFIGEPVIGRLSGERRINVSHRLEGTDGEFAGAVVVSISESYFTSFYDTLRETQDDMINIVRVDGLILARSPPPPRGDTHYRLGEYRPLVAPETLGAYRKVSSVDGIERIYSFRRVANYPLFVSFGLPMNSVMHEWYGQILTYAGIAVPAMLLLLLATWIALRRAREEEFAYTQLQTEIVQRAAAEAKREEAEAALRQAQKMEALGQLTGGIAHDFNNLLTVIAGNIDLVLRKLDDPTIVRRLDASLRATQRGQRLTQQLLAFARRRPLRSVAVSLPERLAEMAAFIGQTMGSTIAIKVELPPDLWPVQVDDEQLQVAVLNLIVNARDAMPDGGEIRIAAHNRRMPSADHRHGELAGDFVALSVVDAGQGIAPEILPRVFEPFFTTKSVGRGSGLGLAQVYSFAKQSNGQVEIDSVLGRGTKVTLYLPRAAVAVLPREPVAPGTREAAGPPRRILVVEDDPEVAEVALGYLQEMGFQTVAVDRATKALDLLARDLRFDLVFSDIIMPDGMSGIDLARQLARLHPGLPVLLTTGYAGEQREIGPDVLRKPYNARGLREAIDRSVSSPRSVAEV